MHLTLTGLRHYHAGAARLFPTGPMCSLRGALLLWLLPLYLVVGVLGSAGTWWMYSRTVNTFMDQQMEVLARSVAANAAPLTLLAQSGDNVLENGGYLVQVFAADGSLLDSSDCRAHGHVPCIGRARRRPIFRSARAELSNDHSLRGR